MSTLSLVFACSLFVSSLAVLDLQLLSKDVTGGKCLDGSQAGYYYGKPPAGSNGDLWVIYLEGGGACFTEASCTQRSHSNLGSSKNWRSTQAEATSYSSSKTENPYFYDGHHVYVPYCAGDVHAGQRATASADTWGFYFDGHLIIENIINDLITRYKLNEAKNVLLTGCSAGGIGTFANLDWLQTKLGSQVTVKGAPVAGWFFAGNCTDEQQDLWAPPNDYPHYEAGTFGGTGHDNSSSVLWDSYLDPVCTANVKVPWHCQSAHVMYKYARASIFVLENQFDSEQIVDQMFLPSTKTAKTREYVEYFGENMRRSMNQLIGSKKDGLFSASCYDHCSGINIGSGARTKIGGYDVTDLTGDWFWETNKLPHTVIDDCKSNNGLPCNPTCGGY
jgi:hypothetical protein